MMFRPLHDRVLVGRRNTAAATPGGIIIIPKHPRKPQEGQIVSVGGIRSQGGIIEPPDLKAGDRILFGKWSGA